MEARSLSLSATERELAAAERKQRLQTLLVSAALALVGKPEAQVAATHVGITAVATLLEDSDIWCVCRGVPLLPCRCCCDLLHAWPCHPIFGGNVTFLKGRGGPSDPYGGHRHTGGRSSGPGLLQHRADASRGIFGGEGVPKRGDYNSWREQE